MREFVIGSIMFGFGLLTGYVLRTALAPSAQKGILESALDIFAAKKVASALGAWDRPMAIERDPNFMVGVVPAAMEDQRAKVAENILAYL